MPLIKDIKKVLVIGSGPIVIGQAAEFDYAGAQACRVLKEEGVNVVLVNSNPATIMTDKEMADEIYLEPLTVETLKRIIEKERPDSLLAGLGGQTGLTLAMQLSKEGFLEKMNVRLIGSSIDAIDKAEDREFFKKTMTEIGEPTIPSDIATTVAEAVAVAEKIGYPVIVRPAFTLGGYGGGVAYNAEELTGVASNGLDASPITQILVEKYIYGWKEIEFETMRDNAGNVIAVCSMENVDPVGVHTGDSIVVAPALTLSDKEYQMLRSASLNIITALGIVGGCNCQFALDPNSFEYAVIEVNPRVSRSSALASKATGYPIAKTATRIALGYNLDEIKNEVTGKTCACFEPALDYVVVKFPKWPFEKFMGSDRKLGTQMKATGEVMAIGLNFESALMAAVRGAEISADTLNKKASSTGDVVSDLKICDDMRIFRIFAAIKSGVDLKVISDITRIDAFFLNKLKNLADFEAKLASEPLTEELYDSAKKFGYPDAAIERINGKKPDYPNRTVFKMVDTCSAEFAAETPYFYPAYGKYCDAARFARSGKDVIIVIGSGPIRIGQGIEFDYSSVHCVLTLKKLGYDVVIINNNPETVSTDYDTADRLYFSPLSPEDVMKVIEVEKPIGVVVAFGGQTAIKLTGFLDRQGIRILGTSAEGIDLAEDREKFDALLGTHGFRRPRGKSVLTLAEALSAAEELGYPVLLRPSYVIGGQNMQIVHNEKEVTLYMNRILAGGITNPVLVDKYMSGPELEVDVISDGKDVLIPGIMQHVERAGVHSGDSIAVYPAFSITDVMVDKIVECSTALALDLGTKGLVNIQYLIYGGELYVIEVNPRASRTVPYISKVTGVEMVDIASRVMLGETLKEIGCGTGLGKIPPYYAVKVPVFSFEKLNDVNSYLGPEMKSTGEVLGIGRTRNEALYKGLVASGLKVRTTAHGEHVGVFLSVDNHDFAEIIGLADKFNSLNIKIYATEETAREIKRLGIDVEKVAGMENKDALFAALESGKIDYIVYTGALFDRTLEDYIVLRRKALSLGIACFTSLDTANALADIIASRFAEYNTELVNLNAMRKEKRTIPFVKMEGCGNDYIFFDNFNGEIDGAESLCVSFCALHYGVGAYGIVLMEKSEVADVKMKLYNRDGSSGVVGGNAIRCVGKYVYDNKITQKTTVTVETDGGIKELRLFTRGGKVTFVSVNMGCADFSSKSLPAKVKEKELVDYPLTVGGTTYSVTCCSLGNPHCVVFSDDVNALNMKKTGPLFENHSLFPNRINTEFVKIVNPTTMRMRAFERGNGETTACGSGACAAVAAAVRKGYLAAGTDITVKLNGGDLIVNCTEEGIILTGDANTVFTGELSV